jgi:hypothetical protein
METKYRRSGVYSNWKKYKIFFPEERPPEKFKNLI